MNYIGGGFSSKPTIHCDFHSHTVWEFIYQEKEHTNITIGDKVWKLNEGMLLVVPPNTVHNAESDVPFVYLHFRLEKCVFSSYPFTVKDTDGNLRKLFYMLASADAEDTAINEVLREKITELICVYIQKAVSDSRFPEFILKFKTVLAENLGNSDFRLSDFVTASGYNPDYFRRIFKKYTSFTPVEYLNRLRISKAKELIHLERHLTMAEIADQCGFCNSFYFSTVFRNQEKMSPREYKKQLK